jgi:hypothetical protein
VQRRHRTTQIVRTEVNVWPIGKIVDPDVKHRKIVSKYSSGPIAGIKT